MSELLIPIEEVHIRSVLYRREGHHDVKKLIERVWVPSSKVAQDAREALHLCKRYFWMHVGLGSSPIWFVWPKFPGWVKKTVRPAMFPRADQLVCQYDPAAEDEVKSAMQQEEVSTLKQSLEEEFSHLAL